MPAASITLAEPLRKLADPITIYALQMLALAYHDPDKREAVADALSPIDEFRASANRRVASDVDDVEEEEEDDDIIVAPVVTTPATTTPPIIALAPVA